MEVKKFALDWIADYFTGRTQYVSYNNCNSATLNTSIGIPHGLVRTSIITSPPEGVARYCFHPVCLSVCPADILVF